MATHCHSTKPPSIQNRMADAALYSAAYHGATKRIKSLLHSGANASWRHPQGGATALYVACEFGQIESVRLLIRAGAPVDGARDDGATPLFKACHLGRADLVEVLLEAGADPSLRVQGWSPLDLSCREGHEQIVKMLLAKLPAEDMSPTLLADLAAGDLASLLAFLSGQQTRGSSLVAQLDAILADTEKQDTLLTWAARHGQAEAARLLLQAGASVEAVDRDGASALLLACEAGHLEIVRLLLEASAAVDQADEDGTTPLHMACEEGNLEVTRLLLEVGAEVNQAADDGATPLYLACDFGHLEVAKLLSSYGASRAATPLGTPEEAANREGHATLAAWLVASRDWTPLQHLEACQRLAAEGVSALSSRVMFSSFRRRSPSSGRGRCCAAARTLQPASLRPSSGRASSARGASRIRPLRQSVPPSRSTLSSRGRR